MEHVTKKTEDDQKDTRSDHPQKRGSPLLCQQVAGVLVAMRRQVPTIRTMQKTMEISQVRHIGKDPTIVDRSAELSAV